MNNVYNHAVDSVHSVANIRTEPAADAVAARTWPLSFRCISVWLILLYKIRWHRRVLIVSRTLFPSSVPWVITEQEHHLASLCSPSWTIVDRSSSNIVFCISVAGEYSEQGCVALSWHSIGPLVQGNMTYNRFKSLDLSEILVEIFKESHCSSWQLDRGVSALWWQACCKHLFWLSHLLIKLFSLGMHSNYSTLWFLVHNMIHLFSAFPLQHEFEVLCASCENNSSSKGVAVDLGQSMCMHNHSTFYTLRRGA